MVSSISGLSNSTTAAEPPALAPPVARQAPRVDVVHGDRRVDDYYWLREKSSPEVVAYLEAENAYTDAAMAPTVALQEKLYKKMIAHIKETDLSVPYRKGDYFYYSRTEAGKQYPIHCRKRGNLEAPEEIILDLNEVAKGQKFLGLGLFEVSEDGNLLAYSTDFTGFHDYTLRVKDLRTDRALPEGAEQVDTAVWANDNRTLFFTVQDAAKRPYRLFRRRWGAGADDLVYEERDELFRLVVERSRSKAFLFLTTASLTASEVRFLPAARPDGNWNLIEPRRPEHEYWVDHHGESFYIRTNDAGRNFRLVSAPLSHPGGANWKEVVPHRFAVMLTGVNFFRHHYVLLELEAGVPHLRVTDLGTGESHRLEFPEPVYWAAAENNPEFDTMTFRYAYESFVTPASVCDYEMEKRRSKLLKQTEVPGYDAAQYESRRISAGAPDGVSVPVSLVYRKPFKADGRRPLLLVGYGAYGYPLPIMFSPSRLALLDRGVVFAIAHIRGGGEKGKAWHDQGRMMKKTNTFTDFIAAAEHLVAENYTSKDRLAILGRSAGGLLIGAVVNMRPDLFKAAILQVPFVDTLNTMLDASLPLTVLEYEEWGNPNKKDEYDYMRTYCPYTNIAARAYPSFLVRTSFNDSAVMYWEPAKYVAKLRALKTDSNPLLFKINMAAGHGGASGRYDYLREVAFDHAFILGQLGIAD